MDKSLVIICAHIDDEVYGMGSSIKKLSTTHDIHVLYVCNSPERLDDLSKCTEELGINTYEVLDYQPQTINECNVGGIAEKIREFILKHNPDGVFTHTQYDISVDHRIVHEATMVACRPIGDLCVDIYTFETCGSSNWVNNTNGHFKPNMYVALNSDEVRCKIKLIKQLYTTQRKEYPHPRSPEAILVNMRNRGIECQEQNAEAFEIILKKFY